MKSFLIEFYYLTNQGYGILTLTVHHEILSVRVMLVADDRGFAIVEPLRLHVAIGACVLKDVWFKGQIIVGIIEDRLPVGENG